MSQPARGLADLDALDAVFGAIAHQSRRTIIAVLHARGGEMTSGAIASRFDCSWPTTSQHLQVLARAGLVTIALRGREHVYRLDAERLRAVACAWLDRFAGPPPPNPMQVTANEPDETEPVLSGTAVEWA